MHESYQHRRTFRPSFHKNTTFVAMEIFSFVRLWWWKFPLKNALSPARVCAALAKLKWCLSENTVAKGKTRENSQLFFCPLKAEGMYSTEWQTMIELCVCTRVHRLKTFSSSFQACYCKAWKDWNVGENVSWKLSKKLAKRILFQVNSSFRWAKHRRLKTFPI